jgi:Family of unknown function (DUF5715)
MVTMKKFVAVLALAMLASPAFALQHIQQASWHKRGRKPKKMSWFNYRVFVPSHENLLSQNEAIDNMGLPRIKNDDALKELVNADDLVPVTANQYVRISPKLEAKRRFCRPWVDLFLQELGRDYYAQFHDQIQVNSAVRTERTQFILRRWNRNAAPVHGETASAHLAGVAVDLQRRGLTREQIHFIQMKLLYLAKLNMVIVEEELKQPCFHIVVTGDYPYQPDVKFVIPSIEEQQKVLNGIINPTATPAN